VAVETTPTHLHRLSPDEYRRLVEAGVFDEDARVELIAGLLVDMSPKTRAHENAIAWLNRVLLFGVDSARYEVRVAAPLTIGGSEPEPDVAVVERSAPRPYHPATAALVIEVAVSSLVRDLQEKPAVYAGAGIPLYWVVDLEGRRVVTHAEPAGGGYAESAVVAEDGRLAASQIGVSGFSVAELFAAADA